MASKNTKTIRISTLLQVFTDTMQYTSLIFYLFTQVL